MYFELVVDVIVANQTATKRPGRFVRGIAVRGHSAQNFITVLGKPRRANIAAPLTTQGQNIIFSTAQRNAAEQGEFISIGVGRDAANLNFGVSVDAVVSASLQGV